METTARRLHPLLTVAAVSLTVFSAVGVAALTGLLPASKGSVKESTPVAAIEAPQAPQQTQTMPAAPAPAVEKAVVKKPVAAKPIARSAAPRPAEPVAYRDFVEPPPPPAVVAQAPQTLEQPKPVAKPGLHGVVESVREVEQQGEAKGVGAVAGGLAGAVLGHNIGDHNKIVTVLGTAGGALLGNQIEKKTRTTRQWEMTVRFDDGSTQTMKSEAQPFWHQGDRVRLYEGKLQPV